MFGYDYSAPGGGCTHKGIQATERRVGAAVHVPGAGLRIGWAMGVGKVSQTEGQA